MDRFWRRSKDTNKRTIILLASMLVVSLLLASCKKDSTSQVYTVDQLNDISKSQSAADSNTPTKTQEKLEGTNDSKVSPTKDQSNQNPPSKPDETSKQPVSQTNNLEVNDNLFVPTNNGGMYVKYEGKIYYRQYTAQSYESTGLWGDYQATVDTKKNMMSIKEDGTVEAIFQDTGAGNIFIAGNVMYLQRPAANYETNIYSVDLHGKKLKEYGKGTIEGIDESVGILVCMLQNQNNEFMLSTIDSQSGEINTFELTVPCDKVLAVHDSFIYYKGEVPYEDSSFGKMKLCRVAIDGTQEKLLVETSADMTDYATFGTEIPCIQFVGDSIYFSYGGYAGTGYFYQGGNIARVKTDGNAFEIIAGETKEGKVPFPSFVSDIFYVAIDNSKQLLYFLPNLMEEPESLLLDLDTQAVSKTNLPVQAEGKPFEYEGGVSVYQNEEPSMTTLIPKVDYSSLDLANIDEYYCTVKDVELCDNWVFYKLEANEYDPEVSIGWRDGYRRIKTQLIREMFKGDKKEILYEY